MIFPKNTLATQYLIQANYGLYVSNIFEMKKIFYNRETLAALNYEIHQMSKNTPFYATQIINPFMNSKI